MYAEDNNATEIEKYDVKVNAKKLGDCLQLSSDQYDAVEAVVNELSSDLMFAAVQNGEATRKAITKNLLDKNIKYMSYILNKEQMHKYLTVLNVTMNNRGININD
jgi:hypothetical protein